MRLRWIKQGIRYGAAAVCGLFCGFLLVPLFCGFVHGGMLFLPVFAAAGLALWRPGFVRRFAQRFGTVYKMGIVALILIGVLFAGLSVWMATEPGRPADEDAGTVIVLGCQVHGGEPSTMLRRRLDAALSFIAAHPDVDVIVTGGKGNGEDAAEGAVMRDYLLAHGVSPERLYVETQARSTAENLAYSREIIEREGLDSRAVVVTDSWHQLRARLFAARQGIETTPVSCRTEWMFVPGYWCRELLALLRALIFHS